MSTLKRQSAGPDMRPF